VSSTKRLCSAPPTHPLFIFIFITPFHPPPGVTATARSFTQDQTACSLLPGDLATARSFTQDQTACSSPLLSSLTRPAGSYCYCPLIHPRPDCMLLAAWRFRYCPLMHPRPDRVLLLEFSLLPAHAPKTRPRAPRPYYHHYTRRRAISPHTNGRSSLRPPPGDLAAVR
jgi:hypothetical protein